MCVCVCGVVVEETASEHLRAARLWLLAKVCVWR